MEKLKNKKGVELTLSTVIIAAILVLVLIVVIFIFVKNIGKENDIINDTIGGVNDCIPGQNSNTCTLTKDFNPLLMFGIPLIRIAKKKRTKQNAAI